MLNMTWDYVVGLAVLFISQLRVFHVCVYVNITYMYYIMQGKQK